jgi:protein OS-9
MKIGPRDTYLCLIPPPLESRPTPDDAQSETTPVHSWSLLQPLSGTCLYVRIVFLNFNYLPHG